MKHNILSGKITKDKVLSLRFSFVMLLIILVLGGILGMIIPSIMNYTLYDKIDRTIATINSYGIEVIVLGLIIITIIILRLDEFATGIIIAVSLCLDWYLGTWILALLMALGLLLVFYLSRSPRYPWISPPFLWLWILFLGLTIIPAIRGALTAFDIVYYYPDIILGAFIMFWLGTVLARNATTVRRFFKVVSAFTTLIALHIIIEAATGKLLLATTNVQNYLESVSNYQLGNTGVSRLGSFFIQPDAGSAFLAMMIFIPLGLFVESSSFLGKCLYLTEVLLVLVALIFTFSTGAWLAACIGVIVFVGLVGSIHYKIQISFCCIVAVIVMLVGFPSQLQLLFQHSLAPNELSLRNTLWQTGLLVMAAYPLTGVGLGRLAYQMRSEPYSQGVLLNNPHNSYLELGAMAGLPVLLVFLALLLLALWRAIENWRRVDAGARTLLGAGISAIIVMCFNSLSFGIWTFPPLAILGWLILGVISSPLLIKSLKKKELDSVR
jgi:O-antigen ligase